MKKWTSLSQNNEDARWENLSRQLKAAGVENEYVPWAGPLEPFADLERLRDFHHVRLSSRIGPELLKHVKVQSSWTTLLGVIDGMVMAGGEWWPMCAMYESFGRVLHELGQDLDQRGSVMIAGAGGAARIAVAAFFKAGFRKFLITNFDAAEAEAMMRDIRARFFGLELEWVPMDKIVLLPGESSVLVNCTPSVEENFLLVELSYLNFLKRPGILFDIARASKPSVLVVEARDVGLKIISGHEIAARSDVYWAKWAFQCDLDLETYRRTFEEALPINS